MELIKHMIYPMNKDRTFLKKIMTYFFDVLAFLSFVVFLLSFFDFLSSFFYRIPLRGIGFSRYPLVELFLLLFFSLLWFAFRQISKSIKKQNEAVAIKSKDASIVSAPVVFEKLPFEKTGGRDLASWAIISTFLTFVCFLVSPWFKEGSFIALAGIYIFAVPFVLSSSWITYKYRAARSATFPRSNVSFINVVATFSIIVPVLITLGSIIITSILREQFKNDVRFSLVILVPGYLILKYVFLFGLIWRISRWIYKFWNRDVKPAFQLSLRYRPMSLKTICLIIIFVPFLIGLASVPITKGLIKLEDARTSW